MLWLTLSNNLFNNIHSVEKDYSDQKSIRDKT